jgi:asparagine synthase (glutamine-hydrolysing)
VAGIYGKISERGVAKEELARMSHALAHRGPEDPGEYQHGNVAIGCRRLAVLDPRHGGQPLSNEQGDILVVHNGEIYNHESLRQMLQKKGHVFSTRTDTEVIAHLYEELGERCVEQLRGMFAFALWDTRREQLVLARDHLGQKPLFYSHERNELLFASEIKAILAVRHGPAAIDDESLHHYLSLRFFPAPHTPVSGVRKIPPAHVLVYRDGAIEVSRYWKPSFRDKLSLPDALFVDGLRDKLGETVATHLTSDVPVGAFLSGGLDSSLIVAMMAKAITEPFPTFSVGTRDPEFNELPYAREVSKRFDTRQFETWAEMDVIELLPHMIWSLDEPSDPVAASKYLASRLAAKHVKVVLGGDGGDELFAGFDRYFGVQSVDLYLRIPQILRQRLFHPLIGMVPESFGYDSVAQKLRWVRQISARSNIAERFAEAVCFFRFNHDGKRQLLTDDIWQCVEHVDSSSLIVGQFEECDADEPIDCMVYADYMLRLPEHSLMLTDRLSMAHGLEVRSPLVDHELVEYVAKFPIDLKIRRRQRKFIQRKIAAEELPVRIAKRKKRGFRFPLASWFGKELYPFLHSVLPASAFVREGLFRKDVVLRLLQEHRERRVDHHVRLWMLLNLQIWYELVVERREPEAVGEWLRSHLRAAGGGAAK